MAQFWEFLTFEIKFRFKSLSTYIYFLLWFLITFFAISARDFITTGNGKQLINGPYSTTTLYAFEDIFGTIVIAAIFGTSILRDFQRDTFQILFTKPITKAAYLGGRWGGSLVACVFAFSGQIFGEWVGAHWPTADHERIVNGHFWWYLQPFFSITLVQIFFLGALFFLVAALSRKLVIVYLQGIAVVMAYFVLTGVYSATRTLEHFWSGVFDPIGLRMIEVITRYWTVMEKNSLLLSWSPHVANGVLLYNRLFWMGFGFAALVAVYALFPMSVEALTAKSQGRRAARARQVEAEEQKPRRSLVTAAMPKVTQNFGGGFAMKQLYSLTRLRISNITHEVLFWALAVLMGFFSLGSGYFAGERGDAHVYPLTFLMLEAVEGLSMLLLYAIATIYAGELVWREKDTRFSGIHDALPMRTTVDWLSKFFAITWVMAVLLAVMGVCGIIMQASQGYFNFELHEYVTELFVITLPQVMMFILLAFFVQTIVSNKFLGHGIVIGVFLLNPILYRWGIENTLLLPGQTTSYTYSDMNGYGHFAQGLFWSILYWFAIFAVLAVISIAMSRRGAEDGLGARWREAKRQLPSFAPALALLMLVAIGSGGWFYYNAHVRNEFATTKERRKLQALYEKEFKKYETSAQPKVIAVDASVDLDPDHRSFQSTGSYVLQNKTPTPVSEIYITDQMQSVGEIAFDKPFHKVGSSTHNMFSIYQLEQPLQPGDKIRMNFKVGYQSVGFRDNNERPELARNGMFFDVGYYPTIGYSSDMELSDPLRRREEGLGPVADLPQRGDPVGSRTNLFTPSADWITYHTVVSTPDNQIALAPGYLQKEWHTNGRHYYEYSMGDTKILAFWAYVTGRYEVRRENYKGINIEVYYDKHHPYDIDDMIASAKAGLDYYQTNYSPFQFRQFRILEFPRYRSFAQSFPNTVPYAEFGFIEKVKDPKKDIDFTYFVTSHELAHQWWAHQLIGGRVAGSNMMSESLAEYSALRVMGHRYGDDNMRKFLAHEQDGYLRGRSSESRKEPPLGQVQRESYVWYQKGSLILYALSDYIGEDKVNLALHNFLMAKRYANADDAQSVPYPDTFGLEAALREQTPADLQYFIDDSFEKITLYDNKATEAKSEKLPDGTYKTTLTVQGGKKYADGNGNEKDAPMNDLIDVGIYNGAKDEEHFLSVRKERITGAKQTFTFITKELPTRAGIDPYSKLIDRNLDDNVVDVEKPK